MANDDRFNPASATREMFTQAINRALNDMTDAEIESLVQSAVGTEMSQRQMADLNLQAAIESSVSAIRSELTLKASTSDVTAAVADEAAARQAADAELHDAVGAVAALGAKNQFNISAPATSNHMTYSLTNGSLAVTSNGNWSNYNVPVDLPAGDYIFSTTISGFSRDVSAGETSVRIRIAEKTSDGTAAALVTVSGNGKMEIPFTWTGGAFYVQYYPNYSNASTYVSSFTASENMIRRAEIADDSYAPYAPTNRELYEAKITLEDVFGTGKLIPDNADLDAYTIIGKYYGGNSAGNTVLHLPVENGSFTFSLEVKQATPSMTYQYLRICRLADDPYIYVRRKYTSWGSWYRFTGEAVAAVQSSAASLMQAGRIDTTNIINDSNLDNEDEGALS